MAVLHHTRRVTVPVALAVGPGVLLALTAAGCAGRGVADQAPADPLAAVRRAPDALAVVGTSRIGTSMEMVSGGTRVTIHGRGGFDYARGVGRINVRLPGALTGDGEQERITELIRPGALYMKNRGAGVPADKWVRIATAELPDGNLVSSGATDPISAVELLRGARRATFVGEEEISGVTVRHYRGETLLPAATEAAAPRSRPQLAAAREGLAEAVIPFDVYLDGQGRPRKVRHQFTVLAPVGDAARTEGGDDRSVEVASTITLYGFGAPVTVEMPEPEDIYTGEIASS